VQRVNEHGCSNLAAARTVVNLAAEPLERGANIDGAQRIECGLDVMGVQVLEELLFKDQVLAHLFGERPSACSVSW
jgi:hypothetical protein